MSPVSSFATGDAEILEMAPNFSSTEIRILAARHTRVNTDLETQINVRPGPVPPLVTGRIQGLRRGLGRVLQVWKR